MAFAHKHFNPSDTLTFDVLINVFMWLMVFCHTFAIEEPDCSAQRQNYQVIGTKLFTIHLKLSLADDLRSKQDRSIHSAQEVSTR